MKISFFSNPIYAIIAKRLDSTRVNIFILVYAQVVLLGRLVYVVHRYLVLRLSNDTYFAVCQSRIIQGSNSMLLPLSYGSYKNYLVLGRYKKNRA